VFIKYRSFQKLPLSLPLGLHTAFLRELDYLIRSYSTSRRQHESLNPITSVVVGFKDIRELKHTRKRSRKRDSPRYCSSGGH